MKFEDLLMQPGEEKQTKQQLQEEVENLEQELDGERQLNRVLQCALQGSAESCSCLSSVIPYKVQVLLTEIAMVEGEINWLERKINELKLNYYEEKKLVKELELIQLKDLQPQRSQRQITKFCSRRPNQTEPKDCDKFSSRSRNRHAYSKYRIVKGRRASFGSSFEIQTLSSDGTEDTTERCSSSRVTVSQFDMDCETIEPNKLSEELVKCLIGIFLSLNQATFKSKASTSLPKHSLTCISSKNFLPKTAFLSEHAMSNLDPYGILREIDCSIRDVGPYKNFIHITRSSLDVSCLSECLPAMAKLRFLVHKLSKVNITYFTYKQKLAFWINIYNACVMHAFLQHGLPFTQEKQLTLLNEAEVNVGGIVLNALAIEHFILRVHQAESNHELTDEKEMLLRHAYGLGYPEPNITFALCRGNWSSPALRVYTPDEVVNELEAAKVEYLEASVGVSTSKKQILVPKLMQWHMRDFADDMESLAEWIYSQLHTSSLKRMIMDCLDEESTKSPSTKVIEIQPYLSEFRYLLPINAKPNKI